MWTRTMKKADLGLLNTEEAAQFLHYHPEYLRQLARKGKVPAVKIGPRAWVFDREELRKWQRDKQPPKEAE